jgi:hypothetical protein
MGCCVRLDLTCPKAGEAKKIITYSRIDYFKWYPCGPASLYSFANITRMQKCTTFEDIFLCLFQHLDEGWLG